MNSEKMPAKGKAAKSSHSTRGGLLWRMLFLDRDPLFNNNNGYTHFTEAGTRIRLITDGNNRCYLVSRDGSHLLVDAMEGKNMALISDALAGGIPENESLCAILLTHGHYDHCGCAQALSLNWECPVYCCGNDLAFIQNGSNAEIKGTLVVTRLLEKRLMQKEFTAIPSAAAVSCGSFVPNGFETSLAEFSIIHNPGHTEGCISLVVDNETVLAGDAVVRVLGPFMGLFFAQDLGKALKSWQILLNTGCPYFASGHGPAMTREQLIKAADMRSGQQH